MIVTTGGSSVIVTVAVPDPELPSPSVTLAVIVCVPADNVVVSSDPLEPMLPSMSDVQAMLAARSPSSVSVAVAVRLTLSPIA